MCYAFCSITPFHGFHGRRGSEKLRGSVFGMVCGVAGLGDVVVLWCFLGFSLLGDEGDGDGGEGGGFDGRREAGCWLCMRAYMRLRVGRRGGFFACLLYSFPL